MKKIIDGKLLDTENAYCVGAYRFENDGIQQICITLYRNGQGEYFLHEKYGDVLMCCKSESFNERDGRESIATLSVDAAKAWTERYLNEEEFIKEFGKPQGYYKRDSLPNFSEDEMTFIAFVLVVPKHFPFFSVDDIPALVKSAFEDRSNGFSRVIDVNRTIKKVSKMNHWQRVSFFKKVNAYSKSLAN